MLQERDGRRRTRCDHQHRTWEARPPGRFTDPLSTASCKLRFRAHSTSRPGAQALQAPGETPSASDRGADFNLMFERRSAGEGVG